MKYGAYHHGESKVGVAGVEPALTAYKAAILTVELHAPYLRDFNYLAR